MNIVTISNFDASSVVNAVKAAGPQRADRMWLYFPGCASDRWQGVLSQYPFRATPDFDAAMFQTACDVWFRQADAAEENLAAKVKRKKETMMFGDEDIGRQRWPPHGHAGED